MSRGCIGTANVKQSVYMPTEELNQVAREAARLDRPLSWVVQRCVRLALPSIRELPPQDAISEAAE